MLDIAFYSWLCFFMGHCAPGFELPACRMEWVVIQGVDFGQPNCYVGEFEVQQANEQVEEPEPKSKPKPKRVPRSRRR